MLTAAELLQGQTPRPGLTFCERYADLARLKPERELQAEHSLACLVVLCFDWVDAFNSRN